MVMLIPLTLQKPISCKISQSLEMLQEVDLS